MMGGIAGLENPIVDGLYSRQEGENPKFARGV